MKYITKKDIITPKRRPDSHKGDNGKALVIGGSRDYVGAVALAGLSALRSGVDWVTIAAPEKAGWAISSMSLDLVVKKYKCKEFSTSRAKEILGLEKGFDAVLIGSGIGKAKGFVRKYVKGTIKPLVIDADGIKHVGSDILRNAIITPHNKELELFLLNSKVKRSIIKKIINEKNIEKKSKLIKKNLKELFEKNNIILLKGKVDVIISKDKIMFNKTGNPGMTKAGTGDVLAGLCLGFLAQTYNLQKSAVTAAYYSGLCGDILLKKKKGFTYLASDIVEEIKKIYK